jgi:hypothetical protein
MFTVICPCCMERVEIPESATGPHRSDPWNVVICDHCDACFEYSDDEVTQDPESTLP